MKLRYTLCFEKKDSVLNPVLVKDPTGYISSADAVTLLNQNRYILGRFNEVERYFEDICLARCTVYCLVSLLVMREFNKAPDSVLATVLCGLYGLTFLALIMHSLNAKVSGFHDCEGTHVLFNEQTITFVSGDKYHFERW